MAGWLVQGALAALLLTSFYFYYYSLSARDTQSAPLFSSYSKTNGWLFVAMPLFPVDEAGRLALPQEIRRVVVDVGAHTLTHFVGEVASDPSLFVIAMEPTPDSFLAHYQNVRNTRILLLPMAASPAEGFSTFYLSRSDQCNSLAQPAGKKYKNEIEQVAAAVCVEEVKQIGVSTISLHTIMSAIPERVSVDMVKIDAQGFDFEVAKSLGDTMPRVKEMMLEVQNLTQGDSRLLYNGQAPLSVIDAWMHGKGFRLSKCEVNNLAIQELNCFWKNCALTQCA